MNRISGTCFLVITLGGVYMWEPETWHHERFPIAVIGMIIFIYFGDTLGLLFSRISIRVRKMIGNFFQ